MAARVGVASGDGGRRVVDVGVDDEVDQLLARIIPHANETEDAEEN